VIVTSCHRNHELGDDEWLGVKTFNKAACIADVVCVCVRMVHTMHVP
jgi:hypothetical protein